jgi:pimeloyl-ACP methyl ester carboxylesterase
MNEERFRDIVGRAYDRSFHPPGASRQLHAINCSGNRTQRLRGLDVPTLVVHGTADPLVRPVGGRETARAIPGARLHMIEGMGHDLPPELHERIAGEIASNARRAGARA